MEFLTSKKVSLILSLCATSFVVGQDSQTGTPKNTTAPSPSMQPSYNASCRIAVDRPYDFFLTGSFIYWQPIQENMSLGVVSTSTDTALVKGHERDLQPKYKPGFKVGIGMNFDYDQWDTYLEYTWFRSEQSVKTHFNPDPLTTVLLPAWQIPDFLDPEYMKGYEKWNLKMDFLDWDLARGFHVGQKLCFRPFMGVRAAWIRQHLDVSYVNTDPSFSSTFPSTFVHQSAESWGVGLRTGISSAWELGRGFRLEGEGEGDILFTQYDLKSKQVSAQSTANEYIVNRDDINYLRTHLDLNFGIGWGRYFINKKYHIDLLAKYGFQVFFDQNMFRKFNSAQSVGDSTAPNGNLYIHGLTATARFDF